MALKTDSQEVDRTIGAGGQQRDYLVLPDDKTIEYVRPVRTSYRHTVCGAVTSMPDQIAETYARDPGFYSGTFCIGCHKHLPVGKDGEFVWLDDGTKVGT